MRLQPPSRRVHRQHRRRADVEPGTRTLVGNAAASDTFGATGWFEPTVSLSTLTFTYTRRSGFPVYQTWFASVARTIGGTVTEVGAGGCPVAGVTVRLVGPHGEQLATIHARRDRGVLVRSVRHPTGIRRQRRAAGHVRRVVPGA